MTIALFSVNVGFARKHKQVYVEQFNSVRVGVPSIIRCSYAKEHSIEINSERDLLYKISIENDTLIVLPYSKNDNLAEIKPEDVIITLKHPNPKQLIEDVKLNNRSLTKKTKSGNLKN